MKAKTLILVTGTALASIAVAAAPRAEEASGGKVLFAAAQALSPGELARANGRAAVAIPLPEADNANLSDQGAGGGVNAFGSELVQNITNQVATAVGTAVATDITINAGNVLVGGGDPAGTSSAASTSLPDLPGGGQGIGDSQSFSGTMPSMGSPWSSMVK